MKKQKMVETVAESESDSEPEVVEVEEVYEKPEQEYTATDWAQRNDPPEPGAAYMQPVNAVQYAIRGFTTLAMARAYGDEGSVIVEVKDVQNATLCYLVRRGEDA